MQVRIDDLLSLARVGRSEPRHDPLDVAKVVASVMQELNRVIADARAVVGVGPLPMIEGDASWLALLFENLIVNAVKYRKPGERGRVSIGTGAAGPDWIEIAVADVALGSTLRTPSASSARSTAARAR